MADFFFVAGVVVVLVLLVPVCVYISVKLGTYAFFRGRELFQEQRKNHDDEA